MRKLSLTVIGFYLSIVAAFSQNTPDSAYKSRKLKFEEINFVSGYYHQNGNNSAVTGGIGTEKLTDFANNIELKLSKYDRQDRKHNLSLTAGIDHYTSASSDKIDPYTISSASYSDTRIYPTVSWSMENAARGTTIGLTGSFSNEFDYNSIGAALHFAKTSKDRNRELSVKLQTYFDTWHVIYPIELRGVYDKEASSAPRDSYSAALSFSQILNKNLQLALVAEPTYQNGLLATRYQRVYFTNGAEKVETLPDTRTKIPLGLRANYFAGDKVIIRSFYRYYTDDWGVKAHTLELETPIKITPFFSLSPFYRYYTQTAADYFSPYAAHLTSETFYTSDYDLSKFNSHFYGTGIRLSPPKGVFGVQKINSLEMRYGHYQRSTKLNSNQLSLFVKIK